MSKTILAETTSGDLPTSIPLKTFCRKASNNTLTDAKLVRQVHDLRKLNKQIGLENNVFEKYLYRNDPLGKQIIQQALDFMLNRQAYPTVDTDSTRSLKTRSINRSVASPSKSSMKFTSKSSTSQTLSVGPKLNLNEKLEIVRTETELLKDRLDKFKIKSDKKKALLIASFEEIDIRVEEISKAMDKFHVDVIEKGWDPTSQSIPAEIWVQYMNEWTKLAEKNINKRNLRACTLEHQYKKGEVTLKKNQEIRTYCGAVDIEGLQVEINVAKKMVQKKHLNVTEMERLASGAHLYKISHLTRMIEQHIYLSKLNERMQLRRVQAEKFNEESEKIQEEVKHLAARRNKLRKLRDDYQAPDIIEYCQVKSDNVDLRKDVKRLEHRLKIYLVSAEREKAKLFK